jgi:hypothetical protein
MPVPPIKGGKSPPYALSGKSGLDKRIFVYINTIVIGYKFMTACFPIDNGCGCKN